MTYGHTPTDLAWVAISLFLLGMSKGGFPVGTVALPMLILVWPAQAGAARAAVGFMLPMLCAMDVCAVAAYRRHIHWRHVRSLLPGMLAGVLAGTLLFVSDRAGIAVSDRVLQGLIGGLGILFVLFQAVRKALVRRMAAMDSGPAVTAGIGLAAGLTSTMAHAAGPIVQMHLLTRRLPKLNFAATNAAVFLVLNGIKLVPFTLAGRISVDHLRMGGLLAPVIPMGVLAGFFAVRRMRESHYVVFIHAVLLVTSVTLVVRALG